MHSLTSSLDLPTLSGQLSPLEYAILETVAYADVFDYPLTIPQLHRYLHRQAAGPGEIYQALAAGYLVPDYISLSAGFVMLADREHLLTKRLHGIELAAHLYPHAFHYGKQLGGLPFVRMVALTGSLAMENANENADFDYFILAENDRVWTCRLACLLLARAARLRSYSICPNFIISKNRMTLQARDIYTAHELTQMIPLFGLDLYHEMRRLNSWSDGFLPNSLGPPIRLSCQPLSPQPGQRQPLFQKPGELLLRTWIGDRLENWELRRKIRRFKQLSSDSAETNFSADWCQGHFDRHAERTLLAYHQRLENLSLVSWGIHDG